MHWLTRSWMLPGAVLIAVACGGSAVASTTATGTAASARPAVKICGEGPAEVRPARMILTCADDGELAEHLHWTSWTATRASATGLVSWLTGGPTHATSRRWDSAAADFTLTNPLHQAGGKVLFSTLHVRVTGRTPDKYMRDVTYSEAPPSITTLPHAPVQAARPRPRRLNAASGTLGFAQIEGWWVDAAGPKGNVSTIHGTYPAPAVAAALTLYEASFAPGNIQLGQPYSTTGWGLWQITPGDSGNLTYGQDYQLLDPWNNAEQAALKCLNAQNAGETYGCWTPWTTYTGSHWTDAIPSPIPAPATGLPDPGQYIPYSNYTGYAHNVSQPGSTYGPRPPMNSRATSPSIAAVAGSGYVEAFQSNTGVLCNRTESGVSNCTSLPMMAGTSPSITGLAGGGYVEAYQNPQGYLCNRLETGTQACTNLQMAPGTSPSIAGTANGGYTEAFQASTGILWNRNSNGTAATTSLGMDPGSSPSISALAGGGYVEAFQNPQHNLCNRLETGTWACTSLGMMAGTSPSIAGTANGGYTEAFQASTGILWNRNSNGTAATTSLGMDQRSSPSISALAGGGYVEAFQNPQHNLCNRLETGTWACTSLGMMAGTSPSIAGTANGGYTEAFQASTGILWNRNNNGTAATTGLGMM